MVTSLALLLSRVWLWELTVWLRFPYIFITHHHSIPNPRYDSNIFLGSPQTQLCQYSSSMLSHLAYQHFLIASSSRSHLPAPCPLHPRHILFYLAFPFPPSTDSVGIARLGCIKRIRIRIKKEIKPKQSQLARQDQSVSVIFMSFQCRHGQSNALQQDSPCYRTGTVCLPVVFGSWPALHFLLLLLGFWDFNL